MDLKEKNVIISGGSTGIGKALAIECLHNGANVIICARRKEVLDEALKTLKPLCKGVNQIVDAIPLDISDNEAVIKFMENINSEYGVPEILINNAGIAKCNHLENHDIEHFRQITEINYHGTVYMTMAALPYMKQAKKCYIVNINSVAGLLGVYGYAAYSPAKFAMTGFSEVLLYELRKYNIGVSVVFPPDTDTPQLHKEHQFRPAATAAIAANAKMLQADFVAQKIVRGIEKEKYYIFPNFTSKLIYMVYRFFPWLVRAICFSFIRKAESRENLN
jgi:3-dehydrosphinganine reductase